MSKKTPKNTLNKMFTFMFPSFELAWKDVTPSLEELRSCDMGGISIPHSFEEFVVYCTIRRALEKYPLSSDEELKDLKPSEREIFDLWYWKALKKFCVLSLCHGRTSLEMEYSYATSALLDPSTVYMSACRPWKDSFSYTSIPGFYKQQNSQP